MSKENVQRQSLVDRVYQHLTDCLASQKIDVGQRLSARRVAEQLAVSRTTVNKAIGRLVQAGWVKPDKGHHPVVVALPTRDVVSKTGDFEFSNQTDSTYEVMLERILSSDFKMGEIIKERKLALELGVNPATVRRAAEWLRNDGLLERLPRRGWRVCLLTVRDLHDGYEIRGLLEPMAIPGAVRRITNDKLDELEKETDRLIDLGESASVYERRYADDRFHLELMRASGRKILYDTVAPLARRLLLVTTVGFRFGRIERSFEEHKQVLKALRSGDEKEASRLLKNHLRNAMKFNADIWAQD